MDQLRVLVAAARRGEDAAYRKLLDEFGARLYGYFLRMTGHRSDAADLLGEISVRLVRSLDGYDEHGRFESWLFTMAANLVRDRIRRVKAAPKMVSLDAERRDDDQAFRGSMEPEAPLSEPDRPAIEAERGESLHRALDRLDEDTRQMIMMRHFGELSYAEIAARTGRPLGTVLARVHRGLGKLRKLLEPVLADEGE